MRPFRSPSLLSQRLQPSRLCGLAVLVLGAVACQPGRVLASCGDYLRHSSDELRPWDAGEATPFKLPCQGPGCSESKPPLQIPPGSMLQFSFDERGWLPRAYQADPGSNAGPNRRPADADAGPDPLRDRLERPPQAA